ncbi:glycosyltransferase family 39 protein [Anaerolineales bacterium HSG25]|nr:glycosyltransferase family 39 protein [Anaerolineales bacterium HSG25]
MSFFQTHRFDTLAILLIIIASSLALFFKIGDTPPLYPWSDESEIAADAVATLQDGPSLFYPGQLAGGSLAVWLESGWMLLAGRSLIGLRLLNGLLNLLTIMALYFFVRELPFGTATYNRWVALASALLMATSTWLLGMGRIATPNWSLVPLITLWTLHCFWRGIHQQRHRYFIGMGMLMGMLFYGYIPGYFVPAIPIVFVFVVRLLKLEAISVAPSYSPLTLSYVIMFLVAGPILIFFLLNGEALLQRPMQLSDTNELSGVVLWGQSSLDMLATFGIWPMWLIQGNFEQLAFNPLLTILFIVGLFIALSHWRQPAYLFILIWFCIMLAPAFLSRSASQGFIFELWRRGIGAEPVAFIFPALAVITGGQALEGILAKRISSTKLLILPVTVALITILSIAYSYWLYFDRWATSEAIPALFAKSPVDMVDWMTENGDTDTLFLFPIRPRVSPTTRPELFTVRYLYNGSATVAFPTLDEGYIDARLNELLTDRSFKIIKLMMSDRVPVDPKNYFEYALGQWGTVSSEQSMPDYQVTTYQLGKKLPTDLTAVTQEIEFGNELLLSVSQYQADEIYAGQSLAVATSWQKTADFVVGYNSGLILVDSQGYELAKLDKPLLSRDRYEATGTWSVSEKSIAYYSLPISPDTPPGNYILRLVAYNAETGQLLAPAQGNVDLSIDIGTVEIQPNPMSVAIAELPIDRPFETEFPNGLRLIGLGGSVTDRNRPGDPLQLSLWWHSTRALSQNVGLMLALAVPDGEPIPLFEQPQLVIEGYSTQEWPNNGTYRANYQTILPPTLSSGDYLLVARLYDLDNFGIIGEQLLTPISVESRPHVFEAVPYVNQHDVAFAEIIQLVSSELDLLSSDQLKVKLQWQALQEIPIAYKMFLHVIDGQGQILAQIDTLPQQGRAPTTSWVMGEFIDDTVTLSVSNQPLPDSYRLIVGWYNPTTGERLSVNQDDHAVLVEK